MVVSTGRSNCSRQIDVNRSGQVPRRLKLNQVLGVGLQEKATTTHSRKRAVQFRDCNNNKQNKKKEQTTIVPPRDGEDEGNWDRTGHDGRWAAVRSVEFCADRRAIQYPRTNLNGQQKRAKSHGVFPIRERMVSVLLVLGDRSG